MSVDELKQIELTRKTALRDLDNQSIEQIIGRETSEKTTRKPPVFEVEQVSLRNPNLIWQLSIEKAK